MATTPILKPEPAERLADDADNVTRTGWAEDNAAPNTRAWEWLAIHRTLLSQGLASPAADDVVIALDVRGRLEHADDPAYWTLLDDVVRDQGMDPADFGIE